MVTKSAKKMMAWSILVMAGLLALAILWVIRVIVLACLIFAAVVVAFLLLRLGFELLVDWCIDQIERND